MDNMNIGHPVNTPFDEVAPSFSSDGRTLYFCDLPWGDLHPGGMGGADIWEAQILLISDFNGDGKVDRVDMGLLMLHWGTDDSLHDIGRTPFGDGIVDSKDLMVLAEHGAFLASDVNYDGVVDFLDLAELMKNWLRQQP